MILNYFNAKKSYIMLLKSKSDIEFNKIASFQVSFSWKRVKSFCLSDWGQGFSPDISSHTVPTSDRDLAGKLHRTLLHVSHEQSVLQGRRGGPLFLSPGFFHILVFVF